MYFLANIILPDFLDGPWILKLSNSMTHNSSSTDSVCFYCIYVFWLLYLFHVFKIFPEVPNPKVINNKHLLVIFLRLSHSIIYLVALYNIIFPSSWKNVMARITLKRESTLLKSINTLFIII